MTLHCNIILTCLVKLTLLGGLILLLADLEASFMMNKSMGAPTAVKRALQVNSSVGKNLSLGNLTKDKEMKVNSSAGNKSSLTDMTEFKQLAKREATLKNTFKKRKENFTNEIQRLTKRITREKAKFKAQSDVFEKELSDIQEEESRIQGKAPKPSEHLLTLPPWSWQSIACAVVVGALYLLPLSFCCYGCCCGGPGDENTSLVAELAGYFVCAGGNGYSLLHIGDTGWTCRREMRFSLLYAVIPVLCISETTCETGPPNWMYAILTAILLRAKWIEWRLLKNEGKGSLSSLLSTAFVIGTSDIADWLLDGAFPVQAMQCDALITPAFTASFAQSRFSYLAPAIAALHFWGIAYMVLILAASTQQFFGSGADPGSVASAADTAGFGTIADIYEKKEGDIDSTITTTLGRVFLENCLQLWLQSSYFCLVFNITSQTAKMKLLASIALSGFGACYKVFKFMLDVVKDPPETPAEWLIPLLPTCGSMFFVAWSFAKVFYAYKCDSHLWNLSTFSCAEI